MVERKRDRQREQRTEKGRIPPKSTVMVTPKERGREGERGTKRAREMEREEQRERRSENCNESYK